MDARQIRAVAFAKRWFAAPDNLDLYDAYVTDAVAGKCDLSDQLISEIIDQAVMVSRFHRGHLDDGK